MVDFIFKFINIKLIILDNTNSHRYQILKK